MSAKLYDANGPLRASGKDQILRWAVAYKAMRKTLGTNEAWTWLHDQVPLQLHHQVLDIANERLS